MSSSNLVRVSYAPEPAYGVTPAPADGPWNTMRKISESLSGTPSTTESEEARSDRQSGGTIQVGLELGGDNAYEIASSQCYRDHILAGMKDDGWTAPVDLGSWTLTGNQLVVSDAAGAANVVVGDLILISGAANLENNGMAYVSDIAAAPAFTVAHRFADDAGASAEVPGWVEIGQTDLSFSMEKNFLDLSDKTIMYRGMLVEVLSLAFTYGEVAQGSFTYLGNGYDTPANSEADAAGVNPATAEIPLNATSDVGLVILDGVDANFCIQSLSVELTNNHQPEECIGDVAPGAYAQGTASVTVEMSAYLADENFDYISKKIQSTPVEIAYYAQNQDGGIAVHVYEAQLSFDDPASAGRDQIVTLDMSGTAKYSETYDNTMRIYMWNTAGFAPPVAAAGTITVPSGDTVVPAVVSFSGVFVAGTVIDMDYLTDSAGAGHASFTVVSGATPADAAIDFANYMVGADDITAVAVGVTVEFRAFDLGTTVDISNLLLS